MGPLPPPSRGNPAVQKELSESRLLTYKVTISS